MICPKCGGSGKIFCSMCKGTGLYHEDDLITEQEYIQTCTTEQLAEWILDVSDECFDCGKSDNGDCPFGKAQGVCTCINKDSVVEWLKQPHRGDGE